jgi:hypothetical protein
VLTRRGACPHARVIADVDTRLCEDLYLRLRTAASTPTLKTARYEASAAEK